MIVLAARPSVGKTSLALNIADYIAIEQGKRVAFFSLETSKQELMNKLISSRLEIPFHKLISGDISKDRQERLGEIMTQISKSKLLIDDKGNSTVNEIKLKIIKAMKSGPMDLIIIDHISLMVSGEEGFRPNRTQEVTNISREIKRLSIECDVPIMILSQLSRESARRNNKEPQLFDLRDSGAIEQDADLVLMMYRDDNHKPEDKAITGLMNDPSISLTHLFIRKHRNGQLGDIQLQFKTSIMKFVN